MMQKKTLLLCLLLGLPLWATAQTAAELFAPIAEVLQHPRCLNCHTATNFPRQGDERRRHDQLIVRGAEDHGAPSLHCSACHQDHNVQDGLVPGAPHWQLAPLSMAWEGLNDSQLCAALTDLSKNGGRDTEALLHHMSEDPLVLWGWQPGANRSTPPLSHEEFVQALEAWAAAGASCP